MIDTNVFISAVKKGWTETTELVLKLITDFEFEIIANDVLVAEYEKYATELNAIQFLDK